MFTPEENPLENSKMTTSSVRETTSDDFQFEEENQETTNSNNNRPKVFNQKQLDHIFLSGFFMGFVICLLNPWGIFLFKDVKYQKLITYVHTYSYFIKKNLRFVKIC